MPLRPLVEAVDLELDPVEPALVDQVALEEAGGGVGEPAAAEGRVDGEAADVDDRAAPVRQLPYHRARPLPVELDDHHAARVPILLDLGGDAVAVVGAGRGEERAHVLVRVELDEEVDVVGAGRPDRDGHERAVAASRRRGRRTPPEASATPARISASPPSIAAVISSSRISAP